MSACIIREYRGEDIPALGRLWQAVFGDPDELIDAFFTLLPGMGTGVAAETDGALCGMAFLIDGLSVGDRRVGYLYAVAVAPSQRGQGLGAALSREAFRIGRRRGAEILCTQPAEPGLFDWYREILGVECVLRRRLDRVPAAPGAALREADLSEYAEARELLLSGRPHLSLQPDALRFQRELCRAYGGGLYRLEGGAVAAAYVDGDTAVVRELLAPEGVNRPALAAALAAQLGSREALLCSPDPAGEPYIASSPGAIPENCVWNLSFD